MFNFKKKEPNKEPAKPEPVEKLQKDVLDLKLQGLMRKVAEQDVIIRRLLELVVMNIEHKSYDKMRPKIAAIQNMLDKR